MADRVEWSEVHDCEVNTFICGYCNMQTTSDTGYNSISNSEEDVYEDYVDILYICNHCGRPTYIDSEGNHIPQPVEGDEVRGLSSRLQELFLEMKKTHSFGLYTSSIMIARTMIMFIGVEEGAGEGMRFIEYTNYLLENEKLTPDAKEALNKVKNYGNRANHELQPFTYNDSKKVNSIMILILKSIYEMRLYLLDDI